MGLCHGNNRKAKDKKKKGTPGVFDANELKIDLINEINEVRALHQAPDLALAREIDAISQDFANKVAK